ncbi:NAD(P)-binding domain-containing protein [Corynebacterium lowii]|uniref:Putative oxidoreductase CzcO n=1 Tax=Corynebacterium lowii TaxID=1544413 RepID=A0A0Q0Z926_9CORY|nr:putative oxidoreductase CzcO [Corynebacterium lowii]MDP9852585.1 cation diffusion facilitator CzcD-associated flavoprotein CzcO [Corynebacterium lowii]
MKTPLLTIIIGAGQAGLACAHELVHRGLTPGTDFVVVDANSGPGGAWRHRWDSLTLGRAHGIADLPGLPMKRPDPSVPASTLVADYYGSYEEYLGLGVIRPVTVASVTSVSGPDSPLQVTAIDGRSWQALSVVNATGTWTQPFIPFVPGASAFQGEQLHTVQYRRAEDFRGKRTLVVGGGLSAVQFLLELSAVTDTLWSTRRPPNFTDRTFDQAWGLDVEKAVRARTHVGKAPASVVRTTGIPLWPEYMEAVASGVLVSRGHLHSATPHGVQFGPPPEARTHGLGPSHSDHLVVPESWQPWEEGHEEEVDIIFWNTGFRAALRHLSPLHLRGSQGIAMLDEVTPQRDSRILLVGYASSASTVGATRAGRLAGRRIAQRFA